MLQGATKVLLSPASAMLFRKTQCLNASSKHTRICIRSTPLPRERNQYCTGTLQVSNCTKNIDGEPPIEATSPFFFFTSFRLAFSFRCGIFNYITSPYIPFYIQHFPFFWISSASLHFIIDYIPYYQHKLPSCPPCYPAPIAISHPHFPQHCMSDCIPPSSLYTAAFPPNIF